MKGIVSVSEIQKRFDLPLEEAAQSLGMGSTAFKKQCRQHGISRWPFRKLKGLKKSIELLEAKVQTKPARYKEHLRKLSELRAQRQALISCASIEKRVCIQKELNAKFALDKVWHIFSVDGSQVVEKIESDSVTNKPEVNCARNPEIELPVVSPMQKTFLFPATFVDSFQPKIDLPTTEKEICPIIQEPPLPEWWEEDFDYYSGKSM